MAAVTSAVIGILGSGYQIADNISQKNKAKSELEDFNRQEINNPFEEIQVDTMRSDQMTKANNINVATSVDALQRLGARGVLAGIPKINESSMLLQNNISADLSRQERENDILAAKGEQEVQRIRENREQQALLGIGQELNVANQNIATGIGDIVSSGLALDSALKDTNTGFEDNLSDFDKTELESDLDYKFGEEFALNLPTNKNIDPLTGLPRLRGKGLNFFRN
jgi:hypothetical protein